MMTAREQIKYLLDHAKQSYVTAKRLALAYPLDHAVQRAEKEAEKSFLAIRSESVRFLDERDPKRRD